MCLCGAIDCPSCGPAQGYSARRVWTGRGYAWRSAEDLDDDDDDIESDEEPEDDTP